jgi:hypothetical protein
MYQFELGHRERCAFTKTGKATCDCDYVSDYEKRFTERWSVKYWIPGHPIYDHYAKKTLVRFSP